MRTHYAARTPKMLVNSSDKSPEIIVYESVFNLSLQFRSICDDIISVSLL